MIRFSLDSALTYKCTETTADDWQDTPENTAKTILELQGHAKAVAGHLAVASAMEDTSALRKALEERFDTNEDEIHSFKTETDSQFDIIFNKNDVFEAKMTTDAKTNSDFRQKHVETYA